MPTYKVVEKKKKSFISGRFTAKDLENLINDTAKDSWTLDARPQVTRERGGA